MKSVTCHISKQRMLLLSGHCSPPPWWALRELRVETKGPPTPKPLATAASPNSAPWGGLRTEENRVMALDSEGAYQGNDFSEPRWLLPPTQRKLLNSVTWDIWRRRVKSLSCVWLFGTAWTVAYQAPPSMGFPGKNTGVGCHFLLQGIFPTQGSNPGLPHCRQMFVPSEPPGNTNKDLLMVLLSCLCCKNPSVCWLLPCHLWAIPLSREAPSWAWSRQKDYK